VLSVGVGGSGRQSLSKLACHMADFQLFNIELTKSYDMNAWRDDLRIVLRQAGERRQPTVRSRIPNSIRTAPALASAESCRC
jgi:dynein heavy chain